MSESAEDPATPASPCINICKLNQSRYCIGCGRSIEEIAAWSGLSTEEKQQVLHRARQRVASIPAAD